MRSSLQQRNTAKIHALTNVQAWRQIQDYKATAKHSGTIKNGRGIYKSWEQCHCSSSD